MAGRRAALAQAPAAWQPSSSSDGRPVWQLEQALTVLCRRDGGVERWIFLLEGRKALRDRGVAAALERIAALDEAAQRPTGAIAAPVPGLVAAPFYYEYAAQGRIWRFTPHFTRGRCSRIDVEELPGRGSGRSAR